MNAYGMDFLFDDLGVSDQFLYETLTREFHSSSPLQQEKVESAFRHDGTSPLPLGMDWSPPPQKWEGRKTVWPHDPHTGWSYCVTVPSWTTMSNSRGSGPVVYYRVQVGIQTPEAVTTTRLILRRFSEFVKLFSELQKLFPKKVLPAPPPRKLLGVQSQSLVEERRIALEIWMEKLLSNLGVSRSAPVAIFLELEAAVRSSFNDSSGVSVSSFVEYQSSSNVSVVGDASSVASDYFDSANYEKSDAVTPKHDNHVVSVVSGESSASNFDKASDCIKEDKSNEGSLGNVINGISSKKTSEISKWETFRAQSEGENCSAGEEGLIDEGLQSLSNLLVALPSDDRNKFSRILVTMQRRLTTAKADVEDLVARLNQELAVRQYLTTKITDLEVELETTKESTKGNLQEAFTVDKERYTQMQWDMEELRRKCLEMEMKLKSEQDESMCMVSENSAIIQENENLRKELDVTKDQLESLRKNLETSETKSKSDLKVLGKEVKSLRSSQTDLKQELSNLMKEKLELERDLQNEKQRKESAKVVNDKLLLECSILRKRLEESSVDVLVEEEDKLVLDTSSSDAIDLLTTSDNRIGLLLAEAQLLADDVENSDTSVDSAIDELRKMVTELFIDNARTRKQINSLIRCVLKTQNQFDKEDEGEVASAKQTVLGKFL
ncbi:unnamed protein product [Amaranthus hypochondriacus]